MWLYVYEYLDRESIVEAEAEEKFYQLRSVIAHVCDKLQSLH